MATRSTSGTPANSPSILKSAMLEFEAFASGDPALLQGAKGRRAVSLDRDLMKRLALEGLAVIRYLSSRGNERCARYLVDRCLGTPDLPFSDRVAQMSVDEAKDALYQEYRELGMSEEVARQLVDAAAQGGLGGEVPHGAGNL